MATKKQKQELVDILKFTPTKVQILIQGYGGESYAGRVDRKIYEYFKANKLDIEEYANDWDNEMGVPEEFQPFPAGSAYECDSMFHASGAELDGTNTITVYEVDSGKEIWEHNMDWNDLEDSGVVVEEFTNVSFEDDLEPGEVAFWGGQGEKGCFFDAELVLKAPFDPKKLKVLFENCDGWCIVNYIEYDGEELDGSGGYSTTGKWGESKWILGGDEEVYEPMSQEDREEQEVESVTEQAAWPFEIMPAKTEWFDKDIKPTHKGDYEVMIDAPWPNGGPGWAEWTGRTWKQDGKKVLISQWRGLTEKVE